MRNLIFLSVGVLMSGLFPFSNQAWNVSKVGMGFHFKNQCAGTSLEVQWLRLHTSNVGGAGSIPGWGTKIPYAMWCSQKIKINLLSLVSGGHINQGHDFRP